MNQKTIYHYDPRNGLYIGSSVPDRNPMYDPALAEALQIRSHADASDADLERAALLEVEPEFHVPANATELPPPPYPDGYGAYWQGDHGSVPGSWEVLPLPREAGGDPVAEPTQAEVEAARVAAARALVQAALDAVARGLGYQDAAEALTYADEPADPKRQAQGQAVRRQRSLAWAWFDTPAVQARAAAGLFADRDLAGLPPLYDLEQAAAPA